MSSKLGRRHQLNVLEYTPGRKVNGKRLVRAVVKCQCIPCGIQSHTGYSGCKSVRETDAQKGSGNFYANVKWGTLPQAQAIVKLLGYDKPWIALNRKQEAAQKILATNPRVRHDNILRNDLLEQFQKYGKWSLVAKHYHISTGTMTYHIQKAGITEDDVAKMRSGYRARGRNKNAVPLTKSESR